MGNVVKLLRIYTDETVFVGDRQVFQYIFALAREHRLAGITVVKAFVGYGHSAQLHRQHVFENDRALLIEIVEQEAKLRAFVAKLEDVPNIGLITLERVEVLGGTAAAELLGGDGEEA